MCLIVITTMSQNLKKEAFVYAIFPFFLVWTWILFFCEIFPLKVFEFKWMQMEKRYLSDITHANSALT